MIDNPTTLSPWHAPVSRVEYDVNLGRDRLFFIAGRAQCGADPALRTTTVLAMVTCEVCLAILKEGK